MKPTLFSLLYFPSLYLTQLPTITKSYHSPARLTRRDSGSGGMQLKTERERNARIQNGWLSYQWE